LRFAFAHNPATLRDRRQSIGQLHRWSGGVASTRLSLGFFLRQGAFAFGGLAAGQSLGYSRPLGFDCGAGEEVVLAEGCWVAAGSSGTTLSAPTEGFQLAVAEQSLFPTKSSRVLTGLGGLRAENNPGT
jgi:hypothetical protein